MTIMPMGGIATYSAARVNNLNGIPRIEFTVTGSVQTWPNWLAISFDHLQEADGVRRSLTAATAIGGEATAKVLIEEYQACLQAISSSVFALDALYGVIAGMITVPEADRASRRERNAARAVWVADAIIRASACMPNGVAKPLTKAIHRAYSARDRAVHPPHVAEPFETHPLIPNTRVPKRWLDYNLETSMDLASWVVEAMIWTIDHPKPGNKALTAWAGTASGMLHRIVDPFMSANANSALVLRRPA